MLLSLSFIKIKPIIINKKENVNRKIKKFFYVLKMF